MKSTAIKIILGLFVLIGVSVFIGLAYFSFKLNSLTHELNSNPAYFIKTTLSAYRQPKSDQNFNVLILGMDYRDDWLEKNQNTDTIILASYNPGTNKANLISFPRDLWDETTNQKINLIYSDSLSKPTPVTYIKDNFHRLTGQNIDRILVLTTQNLEDFIGMVGGVDVYLEKDYIDHQYPNPEYIKNKGSAPIYITVEYKAGWNHIDSTNVAPFVRSRKGAQTVADGGTDLGRIKRQQQLLDALLTKLKKPETFRNKATLVTLYNFWHQKVQTDITDQDIISLVFQKKQALFNVSLNKTEIPVGETKKDGLIYHPDTFKNKQWVFIPTNDTLEEIHHFVSTVIAN